MTHKVHEQKDGVCLGWTNCNVDVIAFGKHVSFNSMLSLTCYYVSISNHMAHGQFVNTKSMTFCLIHIWTWTRTKWTRLHHWLVSEMNCFICQTGRKSPSKHAQPLPKNHVGCIHYIPCISDGVFCSKFFHQWLTSRLRRVSLNVRHLLRNEKASSCSWIFSQGCTSVH